MSCCGHSFHSSSPAAAADVAPAERRPLVRVCTHGGVIGEVNDLINGELHLKWQARLLIVRILDGVALRASAAVFEASRRSGAAALETAVLLWVQQFIGAALAKHACSEMAKPVERLRGNHTGFGGAKGSINIDIAAAQAPMTPVPMQAGLRFPIIRFRNDCTPAGAEINDVAWVHLSALLEYLTAELLEISAVAARANGSAQAISSAHVRAAVRKDEELSALVAKLGFAAELERADGVLDEAELLASFPRTHAVMDDLLRYAWWNHEPAVDRTLRRYLSGTLPQGSLPHSFLQSHLRPVRYYGRSRRGVFVADDEFTSEAFFQHEESSIDSMEGLWMNLFSFDIIDAEGREFPILYELRFGYERHVNTEHGGIFDRRTGEEVAESCQLEDQRQILRFNSPEARKFWALYVPHQRSEPDPAAPAVSATAAASESSASSAPAELSKDVVRELRSLFDASWGCVENFSESRLETQSMWSAVHPVAVVKRFTLAWLQTGFGQLPESLAGAASSAASSSAASDALPFMPVDLLHLIGEYCPIDLPFLPLTVDPAAPLQAHVSVCPARTSRPSGLVTSSGAAFDFFCLREEDGAPDSD